MIWKLQGKVLCSGSVVGFYFSVWTALSGAVPKALLHMYVATEIYIFLFQHYIIYMGSYVINMSRDPKYNIRLYPWDTIQEKGKVQSKFILHGLCRYSAYSLPH